MSLDKDSWEAGVATGMSDMNGEVVRLRRPAFGAAAARLPQQPPSPELKASMDRLANMRVISREHYQAQMLGAAMTGAGLGGCLVATVWAVLEALR